MTKRRKILLASILSVITFGSFTAFAGSSDNCGFAKHFSSEKRAEFMVKRVTNKLDLNETQVSKLKAVQQALIEKHKVQRENSRDKFLALLDAPKLNQNQALTMVQERGEKMKQNAPEMIATIAEFTNSLNDKQRENLQQLIKDFPMRGGFGRQLKHDN